MSKKWKIFWTIFGIFVGLIAIVIGAVVYFGGQFVHGMKMVAQDVYGGPLPSHVLPILGLDLKPQKMVVYMDTANEMAMVVVQSPPTSQEDAPFSEYDITKALSNYGTQKEIEQSLKGASNGQPSSFKLGDQTVHTIKFSDEQGQMSELGILNLDKGQMLFIATGDIPKDDSQKVANFLMNMPTLKNDSHLASHMGSEPVTSTP